MVDGRNERCSCGSGRKAKRCCGVRRGPSESEQARAWLDIELRRHVRVLRRYDEDGLLDLMDDVADAPRLHMGLQFPMPRLSTPELEDLREAVADDDPGATIDALAAAEHLLDTPMARAALGRAVLDARDHGCLDADHAAAALLDLASSSSSVFLRSSLLEAVAVSVGAAPTPSGLLVAGR